MAQTSGHSLQHPPPPDTTDFGRRRVVIEGVRPRIDGGRFPIKRTPGEGVAVTAHVHADGHDVLTAVVKHRAAAEGATRWAEVPMAALGNDEWHASFVVGAVGRYQYAIEAWVDRFLSWRRGLAIKVQAGQDVSSELVEGAAIVTATAARLAVESGAIASAADRRQLEESARVLGGHGTPAVRAEAALADDLLQVMARHSDRSLATVSDVLEVIVDRERARFSTWYEMFPRSWGPDPRRSATFLEAASHLANVAALGFDVVYLPPIHPIGATFRKGRGNRLDSEPGDPGSPWAIGSPAGGHKAVEPQLGTLQDFDAFVAEAHRLGLDVALDLAYQCSPDHPYVREHPEWFRHRPDGTIKYAENPPKKYQDIYPFDFETPAWRSLWEELLDVVRFWIGHGVRIFRVDNPHTKPYAFWEWLIAEIHRDHPETIFLSEAFTRPKIMYYLAKLGFTQSYTYFTWRNTKLELTDYLTELTTTEVREFFRPNLFANTPDILHAYLQHGGPPAFRVRLVLAATLGASYGIYSGFELCENRAVPGTEEYEASEKYQIRRWHWERPGHIKDLIARVNRLRREHSALQFNTGLAFHETDNPELLAYSKTSPDGSDRLLVVVNLDPKNMQHGHVRLRPDDRDLLQDGALPVHDLLSDARYRWRGEWNYVRLDPEVAPAHILHFGVS